MSAATVWPFIQWVQATASSSVSATIKTPRPNNLLLAFGYGNAASTGFLTTPSGFTLVPNTQLYLDGIGTFAAGQSAVWYKVAVGTETTITTTATGTTPSLVIQVYEIKGFGIPDAASGVTATSSNTLVSSQAVSLAASAAQELVMVSVAMTGATHSSPAWANATYISATTNNQIWQGYAFTTSTSSVTYTASWGTNTALSGATALALKPANQGNLATLGVG